MDALTRYAPFLRNRGRRKANLHAQMMHDLGVRIVRGDYPPESLLPTEAALVEEFGISRSVVREAVKSLAAKGLVESRSRTGLRVRPRETWNLLDFDVLSWCYEVTPLDKFIHDLFAVRWIIEPSAAEMAALNATAADLAAIEAALEAMREASLRIDTDPDAAITADLRFHGAVIAACRNELLTHMGALIGIGLLVSFENWSNSYVATLDQHGRVLAAIRRRSGSQARRAMMELLGITRSYIDAEFGSEPPPAPAAGRVEEPA